MSHILLDLEMNIFFPENIMSRPWLLQSIVLPYHIYIYLYSFILSVLNFNLKYFKNYIIINVIKFEL